MGRDLCAFGCRFRCRAPRLRPFYDSPALRVPSSRDMPFFVIERHEATRLLLAAVGDISARLFAVGWGARKPVGLQIISDVLIFVLLGRVGLGVLQIGRAQ